MSKRLSQVLAVEKGVKSAYTRVISDLNKLFQRPSAFSGFHNTYQPINEDGDMLPPEGTHVQEKVPTVLSNLRRHAVDFLDVTATKDHANCHARADVVVDGETFFKDVPPTYLLFLEKQLVDLRTFIGNAPVLDPAESWEFDAHAQVFKTPPTASARTKKVQRAIVLYDATPEHPAQTQLISEDVRDGTWTKRKLSGAIPAHERDAMLNRIDKLIRAVKEARESANTAEAPEKNYGNIVFDYVLKS